MKQNTSKSRKQKSSKINPAVIKTRPSKAALKRAIEKSIKKNKETLKILAKR